MKTLLERQEDAYWQSVNKLKEADEILRDLDTTGWPWMVQQQLEKTRVQLMLTRQQITGGLVKSANKDSATCVNCKYWLKQSMASGECRRHAPQVVAYTESQTKGEHGEYRESVDSHTQSEWPVTPAGEWCGEYEPQNESASRSEL